MIMEQSEITLLKYRLLTNGRESVSSSNNIDKKSSLVSYVTASTKIIKQVSCNLSTKPTIVTDHPPEATNDESHGPLLEILKQIISSRPMLSQRILFVNSVEQLEVTRTKTDHIENNGIPITAAKLIFQNSGTVSFSLITGKSEVYQLDITKEVTMEIEELLEKLDDSYVFCLGLSSTLPEIQHYLSNKKKLQVYQEIPYEHARSKDCLLWYKQSNQTTIRERLGLVKARCPPCKRYFNVLVNRVREIEEKEEKMKKVGRPRKKPVVTERTTDTSQSRKRKIQRDLDNTKRNSNNSNDETDSSQKPNRRKGRPRKCVSNDEYIVLRDDKTTTMSTEKAKSKATRKNRTTIGKQKSKIDREVDLIVSLSNSSKTFIDQDTQTESLNLEEPLYQSASCDKSNALFTLAESKEAALLVSACNVDALYDASDDVVELTAGNFQHKVISGDEVWLVEFYAPWCGHCRNLAPDWKKAATALKGIVKVGAVDMDVHGSVGGPYNVRGFPTIKIFAGNKNSPLDYNGARTAQAIVDEAMRAAQRVAKDRLSGGGSRGGSSGGSGGSDDVVELTDANFEKEVLGTKEPVLVEFFAPWCGHCQRLAPEWKKAASELKGKVKVAALDATAHTIMASRFSVQGYPTIKVFRSGVKDFNSAEDYQGGRTASDIIAFGLELHSASVEPPEVLELISNTVLDENCNEKPLCIISFLPDILDTNASGRNAYLKTLKELGDKYKAKLWGWVWTAAAIHGNLEKALGIGGFGYPAMVVVNVRKKVFVTLRGSFNYEGIDELLRSIAVGRGQTEKLTSGLPTLSDVPAWDGQDGKLPEEEDIDLSDITLDDLEEPKKEEL